MQCPKCHTHIDDNQAVCPKCHKVLLLECPNCHELGDSAVCEKCGYTILVKCSKCSKINHINDEKCKKCGFPVKTSLAYQECENDEFASVTVSFNNLGKIRKLLKSKDLYSKFYFKLQNMLLALTKNFEGKVINYGNEVVLNYNKELSFPTSSNKAVRFSLKVLNAFVGINKNIYENLGTTLGLTLTINKKTSEQLVDKISYESNIKTLAVKKEKKYLKGLQIVLDEYVRDEVSKDFKTDSLYSIEEQGRNIVFYEIVLDSYVLPPSEDSDEQVMQAVPHEAKKIKKADEQGDLYSFKVFDINAKCRFENTNAIEIYDRLRSGDFEKNHKIVTIRSDGEYRASTNEIANLYEQKDYRVINVTCTPNMNYEPWGVFRAIFSDYYKFNPLEEKDLAKVPANVLKAFGPIFDLFGEKAVKAMTAEDARYNYMEKCCNFLGTLAKTVIIIDGFENIDDTTIQTLELYFDKYKNIKPNFVFINSKSVAVHSKFKGLLRTPYYTEYTLDKVTINDCVSYFKSDAGDFIKSFYYEKISENFNGSFLYFINAVKYLEESGVLIDFENKLIIKSNKSVVLPSNLDGLYKERMKHIGKDMNLSLILAYSSILNSRLSISVFEQLGVKDVQKHVNKLIESGLGIFRDGFFYLDNYNIVSKVANSSLKKQSEELLVKNILGHLGKSLGDTAIALLMGRIGAFKEEYLTLWKNSQFAIATGDYDAYLKSCLGYLSLVEHIDADIDKESLDENKKDVYDNILTFLYNYSPSKIYFIENVLLMDAIEENDDDKIVKLSNLMLQGALISSNYTDALGLLHNILSRMKNPVIMVDGEVNTKFLLLSLVNIEILYNIGDFRQCVEIAEDILRILNPETIERVKPASFSTNLFVSHIMDTMRLAGFAKLYTMDDDIEEFFGRIKASMDAELPESDCILAVRDFLAGKIYTTENIEEYSAYSKVIFLLLQEFSVENIDYKRFAQNIYQAKLLASDIHQREIELFCDLMIAYAYLRMGIKKKAEAIYKDVLKTAEKDAIFNILALSKYLLSLLRFEEKDYDKSLKMINDALSLIRKYDNQSQILYALCEKQYIELEREKSGNSANLEIEERKLEFLREKLKRILQDLFLFTQGRNTEESQIEDSAE